MLESLIVKYMDILHLKKRPIVSVKNMMGTNWWGDCRWDFDRLTSIITLQKSLFENQKNLERVLAHEMVHHKTLAEAAEQGLNEVDHHGSAFKKWAKVVDKVMGKDYTYGPIHFDPKKTNEFYLLICPFGKEEFGFAWAKRMTLKRKKYATFLESKCHAKLLKTCDEKWAYLQYKKISPNGGFSVPPSNIKMGLELRNLYRGLD